MISLSQLTEVSGVRILIKTRLMFVFFRRGKRKSASKRISMKVGAAVVINPLDHGALRKLVLLGGWKWMKTKHIPVHMIPGSR